MVIKHPKWFFTNGTKEELNSVRERMVYPSMKTIAIEWHDNLWYRVRVEKMDGRAHEVAFGGQGGEYCKVRLVGYAYEKLTRFVFLEARSGCDHETGISLLGNFTFHNYFIRINLFSAEVVGFFGGKDVEWSTLGDDVIKRAMSTSDEDKDEEKEKEKMKEKEKEKENKKDKGKENVKVKV